VIVAFRSLPRVAGFAGYPRVAVFAVAILAACATAACGSADAGRSGAATADPADDWKPGDYRSVPRNTCARLARMAGRLIPGRLTVKPADHRDRAVCTWSKSKSGSKKAFRYLSVRLIVDKPALGPGGGVISAVGEARSRFRQQLETDRTEGAVLGEHVKAERPLPGMGDEARVFYGRAADAGVAQLDLRKRNVELNVTVQGWNSRRGIASDGSGVYFVDTPLSRKVVEDVAVGIARDVLELLPPPPE
jgi:hypothetical protein